MSNDDREERKRGKKLGRTSAEEEGSERQSKSAPDETAAPGDGAKTPGKRESTVEANDDAVAPESAGKHGPSLSGKGRGKGEIVVAAMPRPRGREPAWSHLADGAEKTARS